MPLGQGVEEGAGLDCQGAYRDAVVEQHRDAAVDVPRTQHAAQGLAPALLEVALGGPFLQDVQVADAGATLDEEHHILRVAHEGQLPGGLLQDVFRQHGKGRHPGEKIARLAGFDQRAEGRIEDALAEVLQKVLVEILVPVAQVLENVRRDGVGHRRHFDLHRAQRYPGIHQDGDAAEDLSRLDGTDGMAPIFLLVEQGQLSLDDHQDLVDAGPSLPGKAGGLLQLYLPGGGGHPAQLGLGQKGKMRHFGQVAEYRLVHG
jgi:hypothetical protein